MTIRTLLLIAVLAAPAKAQYVLEFYTESCLPCAQMRPIIEELKADGYDIRYIDMEKRPDMAQRYGVTKVPTFIAVAKLDGHNREVERRVGSLSKTELNFLCDRAHGSHGRERGWQSASLVGGQTYGGSLDSSTGILLTPPQQYAREMIVPENVRWDDRRIVRIEGGGTGSVVSINGQAHVLSCAHWKPGHGNLKVGQKLTVQSNIGNKTVAEVVEVDPENDCALMRIYVDYRAKPFSVASYTPRNGERVRVAGFPMGQHLRDRYTKLVSATDDEIHFKADSISGESGSPIFNDNGEVIGVLSGGDIQETDQHGRVVRRIPGTLGCGPGPIRNLVRRVASRIAGKPMQYGSAGGGGYGPQPYPPTQPYPPNGGTGPQEPIRECDCAERWDELEQTLNQRFEEFRFTINQTIEQKLADDDSPEAQAELRNQINIAINQWIKANADPLAAELVKRIPPSYLRTENKKTGTYGEYQKIWPAAPNTQGLYSTIDFEEVP